MSEVRFLEQKAAGTKRVECCKPFENIIAGGFNRPSHTNLTGTRKTCGGSRRVLRPGTLPQMVLMSTLQRSHCHHVGIHWCLCPQCLNCDGLCSLRKIDVNAQYSCLASGGA